MEVKSSVFLLFFVTIHLSFSAKLPDSFPKCRWRNDQQACLQVAVEKALKAMKNGIPSLQLLPIDPLAVSKISIQEGGNRPINIKLDLLNSQLEGLYGVVVDSARYNLSERIFDVQVSLPYLKLNGDYVMDGRFLLLPLKGKGKCNLQLSKFKTNFILRATPVTKNKEVYWTVTSITLKIYNVSNFKVNFQNLFNGDKVLGASTNKALNDNWQEFWEVIRPSIELAFGDIFTSVANVIFSKVPLKDLFQN